MPALPSSLADLVARRGRAADPLLTHYDLATGERVELSATTTANWVAKTSNFLVDDLDAERGTTVRIGLPTHWLRFVWLLSAWNVGAAVVSDGAGIGVSGPELIADEPHRVAASLRPLGGRFATPPDGFADLGAEVPGHADVFMAFDPPRPEDVALHFGTMQSHADVLAATTPDSRRIAVQPGSIERDAALLVAACIGGGSLVTVVSATPEEVSRVAAQEGAEPLDPIV